MGVVVTTVFDGQDTFIADVTFTNTKDKVATIPHTLLALPGEVTMTPLLTLAYKGTPLPTTINTTNVIITKVSATATAAGGAQLRVIIKRPHSLGR